MTTMPLRKRSDLHVARKLWHSIGVLAIVLGYHLLPWRQGVFVLAGVTVLAITLDLARRVSPLLNALILKVFGSLMRENEENGLAGTTFLLAGALLVIVVFPKPVATLALLFLGFGDPISSYFGIRYGKDRLVGNKTLQGTMAGFVVCTLIAISYFLSQDIMTGRIVIAGLIAGSIGALAELVPLGKIDDNLSLPLISASLLWVVFRLLGGF
jgi:dolichol kinase